MAAPCGLKSIFRARHSRTRPANATTCSATSPSPSSRERLASSSVRPAAARRTMLRILTGLDHDYQGRVFAPRRRADRHGVSGAAAAAVAIGRGQRAACRTAGRCSKAFSPVRRAGIERDIAVISPANCRSGWPGASRLPGRSPSSRISSSSTNRWPRSTRRLPPACATRSRPCWTAAPTMTLLVTHNLDDAVRLGDRLFLLSARPASILHAAADPPCRGRRGAKPISPRVKAELARLRCEPTADRHSRLIHGTCRSLQIVQAKSSWGGRPCRER